MRELEPNDPRSLCDGRYTLLGILGEGSMGRTYLADDAETGTRVALKELYPSRLATMKDLELFNREAEILQKLSHPRIPRYVHAFDDGEGEAMRYYLAQEFVEGDTLRARIDAADSRWTEQSVAQIARKLLAILDYMHGCDPKVVHRDIKPDNIMIREDDQNPTLVDFGAVREVVRLTMGGGSTIIGTYGYMPPEQLMGRAIPASDLYSIGITLLELLTRQTPQDLHGQDAQRLIAAANVSEEFRRILGRLCSPALDERYETAQQVLGDLDALQGGGSLVHAARIETDMEKKEAEHQKALKKASAPAIVHVGYITLISLIVLTAAGGIYILVQSVTASFQSGFLVAGVVSGAAMFMMLILLGMRYTHDAWQPPTESWTRTRGRVTSVVPGLVQVSNSQLKPGHRVNYSFKTRGGEYEGSTNLPMDINAEELPEEIEFDVYYRQGKPEWHEIQDFLSDTDDAMSRLFSPGVRHTPE